MLSKEMRAKLITVGKSAEAIAEIEEFTNAPTQFIREANGELYIVQVYLYFTYGKQIGLSINNHGKVFNVAPYLLDDKNKVKLVINDMVSSICKTEDANTSVNINVSAVEHELHEHINYYRWHGRVDCTTEDVFKMVLETQGLIANQIDENMRIARSAVF